MDIKTKFSIGDVVHTVDTDTLKIISAPIDIISITVIKSDEKPTIMYGLKPEKFKSVTEDKCFSSAEELMRHLTQK